MFSKIKKLFFPTKKTDKRIKKILEEIQSPEINSKMKNTEGFYLEDFGVKIIPCSHKTGVITHIDNDSGIINNLIYFKLNQVSAGLNLKTGDEIAYTVIRTRDNETCKVDRIYALKKDSWELEPEKEKENSKNYDSEEGKTFDKFIIGQASRREGRKLFIEPQQLCCDLDKVHTSFIPMPGDWLTIKTIVDINPESVDLSGNIVEVYSISPTIKKKGSGRVTFWSSQKNQGVIENKVYFTKSFCSVGYVPCLGDEVTYIAIESDQESYKLRALMVWPKEVKFKAESLIEDILDSVTSTDGISIQPISLSLDIEIDETKDIVFEVSNTGTIMQELKCVTTTGYINTDQVKAKEPQVSKIIKPNETIKVVLEVYGKYLGCSEEFGVFEFGDFRISKMIVVNVTENNDMRKLLDVNNSDSISIDSSQKNNVYWPRSDDLLLVGPKPWPRKKFGEMKFYRVPEKLVKIMSNNGGKNNFVNIAELENLAPCLKNELKASSYVDRFHYLLWLDEIAMKQKHSMLNLTQAVMYKKEEYLILDVPNLNEEKASLFIGDKVIVDRPWQKNKFLHVGYIHRILGKRIYIKFHELFHQTYDESICNVYFEPSLGNFTKAHNAVNRSWLKLGKSWLFPSQVDEKPVQLDFDENNKVLNSNRKLVWRNKSLNDVQKYAVMQALKGQGRPLPFLIFGPPGTGKTVTLIELVIQIYHLIPGSRILLTSPSNSSADLLCKLLIEMGKFEPGELVRYMAYHRAKDENISPELMPYIGLVKEDNNIKFTNMVDANGRLIGRQRINVGTCSCFGSLHDIDLPLGHFTHILVDEAGQVSEPEILIPISLLDKNSGQVVLAGDPQQLGPVCISHLAASYGLSVSLMERLLNLFPYQKDVGSFPKTSGLDPRFVIKLIRNYRSVPEILSLPNEMFYNMELIPMVSGTQGPEADIVKKFNFRGNGRGKPAALIFHSIIGQKYRENDSPSWYNPLEIWQIVLYLRRLYEMGLKCDDIGIISPYLKQVKKIKTLLPKLDLAEPKIGTVHDFQGQERNVIIVSTVRSDRFEEPQGNTIYKVLGFVACPRLLNVAITRARALLILMGNAKFLLKDPYWKTVVQHCIKNGCITGANLKALSSIKDDLNKEKEEEI